MCHPAPESTAPGPRRGPDRAISPRAPARHRRGSEPALVKAGWQRTGRSALVAEAAGILLLGPPGVGETHLPGGGHRILKAGVGRVRSGLHMPVLLVLGGSPPANPLPPARAAHPGQTRGPRDLHRHWRIPPSPAVQNPRHVNGRTRRPRRTDPPPHPRPLTSEHQLQGRTTRRITNAEERPVRHRLRPISRWPATSSVRSARAPPGTCSALCSASSSRLPACSRKPAAAHAFPHDFPAGPTPYVPAAPPPATRHGIP